MMEQNVSWALLLGLGGFGLTMLGSFAALIVAIGRKFDDANDKSEARSAAIHTRINALPAEIHRAYLPREVFAAEMKRLDDAQIERDRVLSDLSDRMSCPARDR